MYAYRLHHAVDHQTADRDCDGGHEALRETQESQNQRQYRTRRPHQA